MNKSIRPADAKNAPCVTNKIKRSKGRAWLIEMLHYLKTIQRRALSQSTTLPQKPTVPSTRSSAQPPCPTPNIPASF